MNESFVFVHMLLRIKSIGSPVMNDDARWLIVVARVESEPLHREQINCPFFLLQKTSIC
jgi:hypothetical protein